MKAFSEMCLFTSLSRSTSSAATARSSVPAVISTDSSPVQLMPAPVFLKSKRWESSGRLVEGVVGLLPVDFAHDVEAAVCHVSHPTSRHVSCYRTLAGCPSGQRERSVKPSAYAYAGSNPAPATMLDRFARSTGAIRSAGTLYARWVAPLAQSAERLHGKEKVYGSIP